MEELNHQDTWQWTSFAKIIWKHNMESQFLIFLRTDFKSLWQSDAVLHTKSWLSLVKTEMCYLFGIKLQLKPMLTYSKLHLLTLKSYLKVAYFILLRNIYLNMLSAKFHTFCKMGQWFDIKTKLIWICC